MAFCFLMLGASVADAATGLPANETAVEQAIAGCLKGEKANGPVAALSGIGRPAARLHVEQSGRLYRYSDSGGSEIICGVVLYDAAPPGLFDAATALVKQNSKLIEKPASFSKLDTPPAVRTRYLGDPLAPGMRGVLLLERAPRDGEPAFQFDYHAMLVR